MITRVKRWWFGFRVEMTLRLWPVPLNTAVNFQGKDGTRAQLALVYTSSKPKVAPTKRRTH